MRYFRIIFLFSFLLGSFSSMATHFMGGNLGYRYLGFNAATGKYRYAIDLTMYRYCTGNTAPMPTSAQVAVYNEVPGPNETFYGTFTLPRLNFGVIPLPGSTNCAFVPNVCVEKHFYSDIIELDQSNSGYHLFYTNCCRNNNIDNLNNPGGQNMTYYAFIPPTFIQNSTPTFALDPVPYICAGDTTSILNTAFDPDNDVLTYSLVSALQGYNAYPNPTYNFPIPPCVYAPTYSAAQPFGPGGVAQVNAFTGLSTYYAPLQGFYVVAVEVREFRNNQLIGISRLDIQIIVIACPPNNSPVPASNTQTSYTVNAGATLCFPITFNDAPTDTICLSATGPIFQNPPTNPPATLPSACGLGTVTSQFCWNTTCSQGGNYVFVVQATDNGCPPRTTNMVFTIQVIPFAGPGSIIGPTSVCPGAAANYSVSNIPGATYQWTITGGTQTSGGNTNAIGVQWGNTPGTYSITVVTTNNLGCTHTTSTTVTVNPLPVIVPNPNPASICSGGSIPISVSGASFYTWSPGTGLSATTGANVTANPTTTTTYTINGTSGQGCTNTQTLTVTVNPLPVITGNPSPANICVNGSVVLTASGANTYSWTPAGGLSATTGSSVTANPTITTTYTIVGTDGNGCTNSQTLSVIVNPVPTVTISPPAPLICANGSVILTASGASAYSWSPGTGLSATTGSTVTANPGSATTYTVTGTSAPGCVSTTTVTVNINPLPTITSSPATSTLCSGGSVILTAGGGVSYSWSPGTGLSSTTGSSVTASPTTTTIYTVTGTDGNGCTNTATFTVTINPLPVLSSIPANPSICIGNSIGINVSGASTYTWSPATGLSATTGSSVSANPTNTTTYSVTGTDGNGCINTLTITVTVNPLPTVSITPSPASLCANGNVIITASGASTYSWSPGTGLSATTGSTVTASPSSATTYTVTGTSGAGCINTNTVSVSINPLPTITSSPSSVTFCTGGSALLSASGGISYTWSPGTGLSATTGATVTASPTTSITYTITGTDGNGCTNTSTISVTVNALPVISTSPPFASICFGNNISVSASGGISYTWSPGTGLSATTGSPVTAGPTTTTTYTVTGTDGNGCSNTYTFTLTVNPLPTLTTNPANPVICSGSNTIITTGGATIYTWTPGTGLSATTGSSVTAGPTATTTYTITGTGINGCTNTQTVTVTVNPLPTVTLSPASAVICLGNPVVITASGAGTYTWSPATGLSATTGTSVTAGPTSTTTYTVTGTDGNGCTRTQTILVTVNPLPVISSSPSNPSVCIGNSVSISANGGVTYTWAPSSGLSATTGTTVSANPTSTTTYTITGTDGNGCTNTATVTVTVNPLPVIAVNPNPATICNGSNIILSASGASTYTWSPASGLSATTGFTVSANPTITTTYTITGTNGNGCVNTASITVTVNPQPTITLSPASATLCLNGNVSLTAGGGISYTWQPGTGLSSTTGSTVTASPTTNTVYTVTGTDGNGCTGTQSIIVVVNPNPVLTVNPAAPVICSGGNILLTAGGASNYIWSPGTGLSATTGSSVTANPTATTTYTITGTDGNGCTSSSTITVTVNSLPDILVSPNPGNICNGDSVLLTASGGNTYSWSPAGSLSSGSGSSVFAFPTSTTTYTITGTDVNGCSNTTSVTVTVNALPVLSLNAAPSVICFNDTTLISAGGAINYSWQPGTGLSATTGSTVSAFPTTSTTYTITGTGSNGCSATSTITIIVNPLPVVSADTSHWLCPGDTTQIFGTGIGTYLWSPSVSLSGNTLQNPIAFPSATTTYTLTVTDINGCVNRDTVTITVNSIVPTNAGGPFTICTSGCVNLGGNPTAPTGSTYQWSPATGLSNPTAANPIACPTTTTIYTVTTTNWMCNGTDTVTVFVNTTLNVQVNPAPASVCSGSSVVLTATGAVTYTWTPSTGLSATTGSVVSASPSGNIIYYVTGTDASGCSNTDTVAVTVNPVPNVNAGLGAIICPADSTQLNAVSATGITYSWAPANGLSCTTCPNPWASPGTTTTYTVTVTDTNGCTGQDSVIVFIYFTNGINAGPASTICKGGNGTQLSASGGTNYSWSPANGLSCTTCPNPIANPSSTTTYTLTGTDANGCLLSDTVTVTIQNCPETTYTGPSVPTGFTPNGDGTNDILYVKGGPFKRLNFRVYNNWGNEIFRSMDQSVGWDGTYKGIDQPGGVYVWVLEVLTMGDEIIKVSGDVTLFR